MNYATEALSPALLRMEQNGRKPDRSRSGEGKWGRLDFRTFGKPIEHALAYYVLSEIRERANE